MQSNGLHRAKGQLIKSLSTKQLRDLITLVGVNTKMYHFTQLMHILGLESIIIIFLRLVNVKQPVVKYRDGNFLPSVVVYFFVWRTLSGTYPFGCTKSIIWNYNTSIAYIPHGGP